MDNFTSRSRDNWFQSSPSPKTGRYVERGGEVPSYRFVPILTQSEDWALSPRLMRGKTTVRSSNPHPVRRLGAMLPRSGGASNTPLFQSSPSPKTGRYLQKMPQAYLQEACSNPHPVQRLGAILHLSYKCKTLNVPILTQSEDWALLPSLPEISIEEVPILTQSEDWALLNPHYLNILGNMFQSSPSPKTGRYLRWIFYLLSFMQSSNPHPVRRLGAI